MHTTLAETVLTPEQFLELEDSMGYEFVNGHLEERHVSEASSGVGAKINFLLQIETSRTYEFRVYGADLTYRCFPKDHDMMRRPDVSLIRSSRLADVGNAGVMPIAADLVVEVLSPTDLVYEVDRKIDLYLESGFGLVWIVNPDVNTVCVYRPDGTVTRLHEKDDITGETALPGFTCKVGEFFRR